MRRYHVDLDGTRISCTEWSPPDHSKATILCLHGFGSTGYRAFGKIAENLTAASYTVLAPDLPGFGDSGDLNTYSLSAYSNFVVGLLRHEVSGPVILLGHSFSAKLVLSTLIDYPGIVQSYIITNPAGFSGRLEKLAVLGDIPGIVNVINWKLTRFLIGSSSVYRLLSSPNLMRPLRQLAGSYRNLDLDLAGYRKRLESISIPGCLIWGESDPILSDRVVTKVSKELNSVPIIRIADGNHPPMITKPEEFASAVLLAIQTGRMS